MSEIRIAAEPHARNIEGLFEISTDKELIEMIESIHDIAVLKMFEDSKAKEMLDMLYRDIVEQLKANAKEKDEWIKNHL